MIFLIFGCGDDFVPPLDPVSDADLPCQSVDAVGVWESVPADDADCSWMFYAANTTYVFSHPLGREPRAVLPYISFVSSGTGATLATGDVAVLQGQSESSVILTNGQNQNFWIRLVLF